MDMCSVSLCSMHIYIFPKDPSCTKRTVGLINIPSRKKSVPAHSNASQCEKYLENHLIKVPYLEYKLGGLKSV